MPSVEYLLQGSEGLHLPQALAGSGAGCTHRAQLFFGRSKVSALPCLEVPLEQLLCPNAAGAQAVRVGSSLQPPLAQPPASTWACSGQGHTAMGRPVPMRTRTWPGTFHTWICLKEILLGAATEGPEAQERGSDRGGAGLGVLGWPRGRRQGKAVPGLPTSCTKCRPGKFHLTRAVLQS